MGTAEIHPTAVVHPGARIGAGSVIGPFCLVGEHVSLGASCHLHSHVVIDGHTELGEGNVVFPFTTIGLQTQDLKWNGGTSSTRIGDHNTFRESVTVHAATGDGDETVMGSHNHLLAYCHIAHDALLGNHIIMSNNSGVAGHVVVDDYVVFGAMSGVHQFCRVGECSIIGGLSKVVQDVPPFMLADGNPARTRTVNRVGLERKGVSIEAQTALKQAYRILFREGLTMSNAVARIEERLPDLPEIRQLAQFVRDTKRGIGK